MLRRLAPAYGSGRALLCARLCAMAALLPVQASAIIHTVVNNGDAGAGSFRQAILNANATAALDTINFNIAGAGPHTINLSSDLPAITFPVFINGSSQPGSTANSGFVPTNAVLRIEVNGGGVASIGIDLAPGSSGSRVQSLCLNRFTTYALRIQAGSANNRIRGNFFGTNITGTAVSGGGNGVLVLSSNNELGGGSLNRRNIIAGSATQAAITLSGAGANNNTITTNYIGVAANGTTFLSVMTHGIRFESGAHDNAVGGQGTASFNLIGGAIGDGISVVDATTIANDISGNHIWGNGDLGIDLNDDGVTANDPGDADTGPNGSENFPTILAAFTDNLSSVYVKFSFNGLPSRNHRFDFYANTTADPTGYGEGRYWIGAATRTTDAAGNLTAFASCGLIAAWTPGTTVCATATDITGDNTSEFSAGLVAAFGELRVTNLSDAINGDVTGVMQLILDQGPDGISLREAITAGNNSVNAFSPHHILFDLPGPGAQIISPATPLPPIQGDFYISGHSDPEWTAAPVVHIDGISAGAGAHGIHVLQGEVIMTALSITRFSGNGVLLATDDNQVRGCYLGLAPDGSVAGNTLSGARVLNTSNNDLEPHVNFPCVISGNVGGGVVITGNSAQDNVVRGCYIGLNPAGTAIAGPQPFGVEITAGADNNFIGDAGLTVRTLISGHSAGPGVRISGSGSDDNVVERCYIGTDITGTIDLGNAQEGVWIGSGARDNEIGGNDSDQRNVISGNLEGVVVTGAGTQSNRVLGNHIGLIAAGTLALPNDQNGVHILAGAANNVVGGTDVDERNNISANGANGILVEGAGTNGSRIINNYIGLAADGATLRPNTLDGIRLSGGSANAVVGGTTTSARNVVAGNQFGVRIDGSNGNQLLRNHIGTNAAGTLDRGNVRSGVIIAGASATNQVGSATNGNTISGNDEHGVLITGAGAVNNTVRANLIGTNAAGTSALANTWSGVHLAPGTSNNSIGGTAAGSGNTISGNGIHGIHLLGPATANNLIEGDRIGTNLAGTGAVPNALHGVLLENASSTTIGGNTATAANVIAGNAGDGIRLLEAANNTVRGNFIGCTAALGALANAQNGVRLQGSTTANNRIGGTLSGEGNAIRSNTGKGITLLADGGTGNSIRRNNIHVNGALGIDLNDDGLTPNDAGDGDAGPNDVMNYPVLTRANALVATTVVVGSISTAPLATVSIEFFSSPAADPSGYGEGAQYQGTITATADASGSASFTTTLPALVPVGHVITSTNTNAANSTSEFSNAIVVLADLDLDDDGLLNSAEIGDSDGDGVPNALDLDSDNDGIYDAVESGSGAPHTAGVLDGPVDLNGVPVVVDGNSDGTIDYTIDDSDTDGTADFLELDSDADACNDVIEAGLLDPNSDGFLGGSPVLVDANGRVLP